MDDPQTILTKYETQGVSEQSEQLTKSARYVESEGDRQL